MKQNSDIPRYPALPALDAGPCLDDPTEAVRALVARRREWFVAAQEAGCDPIEINRASSDAIDGAVARLYGSARRGPHGGESAVLALGGYGRREMAPQSDVDLLFLIEDDSRAHSESITDAILYPFWDSGVNVGGATRTVECCAEVMCKDVRALTAMLDARLIAGSPSLFRRLREAVSAHFADPSNLRRFIELKIEERQSRKSRFSGSMYLTQPNVKEGEGGLREFQTLFWIASVSTPGIDVTAAAAELAGGASLMAGLERSYRFLWAVRHALHLTPGSHGDRLVESVQPKIAGSLGFKDSDNRSAQEHLMSRYCGMAEPLYYACERAIETVMPRLRPPSRLFSLLRRRRLSGSVMKTGHGTLKFGCSSPAQNPLDVLGLFAASGRSGLPVDAATRALLASGGQWRSAVPGDGAAAILREIFSEPRTLCRVLTQMRECGALGWAFPEMEEIFHRVQASGLHAYTVGVHSLKTVAEAAAMAVDRRGPFAEAAARIRRPHVLTLAAFLHDVGKGGGEDHEERGACLAGSIAGRLGLGGRDCDDVEFLVRSHLLMSNLAFRRDIRDPALIDRFAQSVRSAELLSMLYIITCADIRAVGPNVWSGWKGGLLAELYERTHGRLAAGGMSPERRSRAASRLIRSAMRSLGSECDQRALQRFLLSLPERYLFSVPPESVAAHFMMSRDISRRSPATFTRSSPERGCTELAVVAADSPGLFAKIAGVLSANGANIVDAQLYTSSDGVAIDLLWVTDALHRPYDDDQGWADIRRELAAAVSGERDLKSIVGGRFKRRLIGWSAGRRPVEVAVDNDVSASHTVVEISADDRRGLLYTIADTMHDMGLSIDVARISTHVDRVTDVFYIKDSSGGKIDARERIEGIRVALTQALAD